jgi:hypothetical protein
LIVIYENFSDLLITEIRIGSGLEQPLGDDGVAAADGNVERALALEVDGVRVGAELQKFFDDRNFVALAVHLVAML